MGNVNIGGVGVGGVQLGSLGFPSFIDDRQQLANMQQSHHHHHQQQQSAIYYQTTTLNHQSQIYHAKKMELNSKLASTESAFFSSDQLIKFASGNDLDMKDKQPNQFEMNFDLTESNNYYELNNADLPCFNQINEDLMKDLQYSSLGEKNSISSNEDVILSLIKKTISPSDSPTHDSLSLSSDSGCRSNSFINDEDSAITSIQSSVVKSSKKTSYESSKKILEDCTISEHLEFTCSVVKDENEEVKNEEIEDDIDEDDDDDCSSDCDTSDDASDIRSEADSDCLNDLDLIDENFLNVNEPEFDIEETNRFNQVVDKDGSIMRKKLESGIYKSINQTLSLFIEPHDILKQMEQDEFDEYSLFPNDIEQTIDSILVIKNHLYLI